ncbi:MAG: cytochrome-c oxidase, cbb3-type subunit II [Longimonas sp.]|uniref:cytochrome-c oxidase, cbb3-type subunit II n=1 Tax=Longimonas sp. TaxID=2039626 RepID=UPI0033562188
MSRFIKKDGMHRSLEGWPLVFTVLTTVAILVGGLVQIVPLMLAGDAETRIDTVEPFTPLELAGRDLYIAEGCVGCHSQAVRPFRHELERYGEYQKAGETVYERPFLWGSKRTGPDLARVGGKYPHLWHVRHMEDPTSTSPGSIMPPYPWMLEKDANLDVLPRKLRALRSLGTPYTDDEVENAVQIAQQQAEEIAREIEQQGGPANLESKQIVALVAYLQRLGTDIDQAPETAEQEHDAGSAMEEPTAEARD